MQYMFLLFCTNGIILCKLFYILLFSIINLLEVIAISKQRNTMLIWLVNNGFMVLHYGCTFIYLIRFQDMKTGMHPSLASNFLTTMKKKFQDTTRQNQQFKGFTYPLFPIKWIEIANNIQIFPTPLSASCLKAQVFSPWSPELTQFLV